MLTSMLGAEALAYLEVERGDVRAGERVEIEILCSRRVTRPRTASSTYPYRVPVSSRSFARLCVACTLRTVPERERITSDSVVAAAPSR